MLKEEESSKSLCPPLWVIGRASGGQLYLIKSRGTRILVLSQVRRTQPWRSIAEGKSSRTFSVLDYGAKWDGTNDDTKVNEQFYGLAA
ncbi:hypothetical protein Bca4012_072367 [Brassica carinata]